jgi:hypothetical protein
MKKGAQMKRLIAFFTLLTLSGASPVAIATNDLELPSVDCDRLADWSETLVPDQTFEPRPGLELNTLFRDDRIVPLFEEPVLNWQREHFLALGRRLNECRREMYRADNRAAGDAIYAAMKTARDDSKSMRALWTAQNRVEQQVGRLLKQPPSPELTVMLDMAQQALQGTDVTDRVAELHPRHQGRARQVAQLSQYRPLLSRNTLQAYTEQLEEKKSGVERQVAEEKAEFDALLQQIAAVPATEAGWARLKQISYDTDRSTLSREEVAAYNSAMQQKTRAIQQARAAQQAQARTEAARPIDLAGHLQGLLNGDDVETLSVAGLQPGMSDAAAVEHVTDSLGLGRGANPLDSAQFAVRRGDGAKYNEERRTGPRISLAKAGNDTVGQIIYEEFFRARVKPQSAAQWLQERLGEPDDTEPVGGGTLMTWRDGGVRLQVLVTNSLEVVWKGAGYEGRLAMALWNRDYERHLDKVNEQCAAIRDKPRNAWSMNDSQFFAAQCPMMPGAEKRAGLN